MQQNNKVKISQQEINDIYEITKEEPFPKVTEVTPKEEKEQDNTEPEFLTEEEQEYDKILFETHPLPKEEEE